MLVHTIITDTTEGYRFATMKKNKAKTPQTHPLHK